MGGTGTAPVGQSTSIQGAGRHAAFIASPTEAVLSKPSDVDYSVEYTAVPNPSDNRSVPGFYVPNTSSSISQNEYEPKEVRVKKPTRKSRGDRPFKNTTELDINQYTVAPNSSANCPVPGVYVPSTSSRKA
jgi:hypothetical protein